MSGYVYMQADRYRGAIYTGVAKDIARRNHQHVEGSGSSFVSRYGLNRLVYVEHHHDITDAIRREKAIKKWRRAWKIELIESVNPGWLDLSERIHDWM